MASPLTPEELALIQNLLHVFEGYAREYHTAENADAENATNRCTNHIMQYRRLSELLAMNPGNNPWDTDGESEAA